jgi:hypothetical protein
MRLSLISVTLLATLALSAQLRAEEAAPGANETDKKKAAELIKQLGADDFQTRETAEKALSAMGPTVLPVVKETATSTADAEVRTRCEHVIESLALEAENNPEELAKMARTAAEAKKFGDASKFYAKAARIFKEQGDKSDDTKQKKELAGKSAKAAERQQRADAMAKMDNAQDGQQMIVNGGRIRIIRAQGGMVVSSGAVGDDW